MKLIETNTYRILLSDNGQWIIATGQDYTTLPTSGVPEGALFFDEDDKRFYCFTSGSWAALATTFGALTTGALTSSGVSTLAALAVTGDVTVGGNLRQSVQALTGDGAISELGGVVILNKAGAIAATLADPTATTDDGKVLQIISVTAQAHTVDNSAGSGFNGGGAGSDVGTFGGAIGDSITLVAYGGVWYVLNNVNVTLA